ncbi:NAD(P)-dependent oxidoreductase [Thiomicrospira microaerophila]|uniref:sugar nucleotide-binding protein n=1 Tax=Thiomicrospira microaerophila TaxID=406020 RepID=UPI00201031D9|nr:sugar nucleotide-binding protein [Thiomicrospira microaerophila]UQB43257.1 NAD(P)-dependent oxidoreductase [Thiomicrospira microaerophila]
MIVGSGQIATIFKNDANQDKYKDVCIFASGVANSNCTDPNAFLREEKLLLISLSECQNKKFVYFSSCALSATEYPKNDYYNHKFKMEQLIKNNAENFLICRVPQLFGDLKKHGTLINFIYNSIVNNEEFNVYSDAYRYVIDIDDVKRFVDAYLNDHKEPTVIDLGNPFRYRVLDLVKTFEDVTGIKAKYKLIEKSDSYILQFEEIKNFVKTKKINTVFGEDYFLKKISLRINDSRII